MKTVVLLSALLLSSGCTTLFTKEDVIRINTAIIKKHQRLCGDVICESSENIDRPEVVMRLLSDAINYEWREVVGTEYYSIEYESKEWSE